MKITRKQLKKIIRESMSGMQGEWDPSANMPDQSFGGDMTGKNYRIEGAAEFYGVPVEELRAALDFENMTAGEIDQLRTDTMVSAYKSMDFNDRHGKGREGRIGEVVLQMLRDGGEDGDGQAAYRELS